MPLIQEIRDPFLNAAVLYSLAAKPQAPEFIFINQSLNISQISKNSTPSIFMYGGGRIF